MKITITKEFKITALIYLIVFCIQATDIKIGFIKVSELILLILTPFLLIKKQNKYFVFFFFFFFIELLISFIITYNTNYFFISKSLLKMPYMISIGRFAELMVCLTLSALTYNLLKKNSLKAKEIITRIVNVNIVITIVFVAIYILVVLRIIPMDSSVIVYSDNRLRGLYVEGGPYGLMLSFIFILTYFTDKKGRIYKQFFLVLVIALMAKSKAGFICVLLIVVFKNSLFFKEKLKGILVPILVIFFFGLLFIGKEISYMYVNEMNKIHVSVKQRPNDTNLIMGRLSAFFLAPRMIKQHPIFGIGIGNYPLIRNNKEIREFFPLPPMEFRDKDASGLGGIVDIQIDMGITGLLLFIAIMVMLAKEIIKIKHGIILILFFIFLFFMGVQLYFLYPWVMFAIVLAYKNKYIDEISN